MRVETLGLREYRLPSTRHIVLHQWPVSFLISLTWSTLELSRSRSTLRMPLWCDPDTFVARTASVGSDMSACDGMGSRHTRPRHLRGEIHHRCLQHSRRLLADSAWLAEAVYGFPESLSYEDLQRCVEEARLEAVRRAERLVHRVIRTTSWCCWMGEASPFIEHWRGSLGNLLVEQQRHPRPLVSANSSSPIWSSEPSRASLSTKLLGSRLSGNKALAPMGGETLGSRRAWPRCRLPLRNR